KRNSVARAWREMEIRGIVETQQGTGSFITHQKVEGRELERRRQLDRLVDDFVARARASGFSIGDLLEQLQERRNDAGRNRKCIGVHVMNTELPGNRISSVARTSCVLSCSAGAALALGLRTARPASS